MSVWCEDHKRLDCSHELSKLIAELASENERLSAELAATMSTLNAAIEGRKWQLERAMKAEAEVERLRARLKIATDALDHILMRGRSPGAWALADDALTQISVMEDDAARAV